MSISSLLVRGLKKGRWTWNESTNELQFVTFIKEKKQKKQKEMTGFAAINGLTYTALKVDLKFKATVNEQELMDFRHFLKKRNAGREDAIVTIQDCKIVAIFLCVQQLPSLFHKFYNLLSVNQLLRACIVYIQFYLQILRYFLSRETKPTWFAEVEKDLKDAGITPKDLRNKETLRKKTKDLKFSQKPKLRTGAAWTEERKQKHSEAMKKYWAKREENMAVTCETIVKTQHYLKGNPLSPGRTSTYQALKDDLDDLRVLIGRFYAGILFAEFDSQETSKTDKLMLFEYFLRVSTVVVWIALERKYLNVIKIELERIFRTGYFNNINKKEKNNVLYMIKSENHGILNGKISDVDKKKNKVPNRLTSNSPVIHNFLRMDEPKLVMIGRKDFQEKMDDRLQFLTKYIFLPETNIQEEGVSIGILGLHRRLFDPLLYPCSKRVLKLLVTGSPMDITEDRKRLREFAVKKALRESEPQSPHIFDELAKIPRPNVLTKEEVVEVQEEVAEAEEEVEEPFEAEADEMSAEDEGEEDEMSFELDL